MRYGVRFIDIGHMGQSDATLLSEGEGAGKLRPSLGHLTYSRAVFDDAGACRSVMPSPASV
jgi:hypothetical protein